MVENPRAFPRSASVYDPEGMTLREYYLGKALAGLLANPASFGAIMQGDPDVIASACGTFADALLAERQKGGDA